MADFESLVSTTLSVFTELPFDMLEQEWINKAWDNKYTDIPLADVNLLDASDGNAFALLDELSSACEVCKEWYRFSGLDDAEDANTDDKLWKTLMDNGVHYKALLGLVYTGIGQGNRGNATIAQKKIALRFAKLYFNLVLVPGSSAYRIFQESLFQNAVQCFRLPSKNVTGSLSDAFPGGKTSCSSGSASRSSRHGGKKKQAATQDHADLDGSESISVETEVVSEQVLLDFMTSMAEALSDLAWMLQIFNLRSYTEVIEFTIQQLCELTQLDIAGAEVVFNVDLQNPFRSCHYRHLTTFAYCSLKLLCLPQHGESQDNFCFIAKNLMPHVLMLLAGNAYTVPKHITNIRDHAVSFLCHVTETSDESLRDDFEVVLLTLVHNVAFHAVDRTDFRHKTSQAVLTLMAQMGDQRFLKLVDWFLKLAYSPIGSRRVFALEMILALIWDSRVADKRSDLLLTAMKRCNDKAATVKTKALSVLASVTSECPDLWVPLLRISAPVELDEGGGGEQVTVEDDRLSQLIDMLKYCVEDTKVNVRKAALSLLQNVLCASKDFIRSECVEILKASCLDPTLLVRKQALQSLTRCLQAHPEDELVMRLWLEGALPLVLDPELSVLEKAVETVEELVLGPLCQGQHPQLAWRLLALISQGAFADHHKYLQQAVIQLHRSGKIRPSDLRHLMIHIGGPNNASVWLLLSKLSLCCDLGVGDFALTYWKQQSRLRDNDDQAPTKASNETMNHVLSVLMKVAHHLPSSTLRELISDLESHLSQMSLSVEVIPKATECLHSLSCTLHKERPELGERAVQNWCKQMLEKCNSYMSLVILERTVKEEAEGDPEELLVRHLVLLGEVAQVVPRAVSSHTHHLVQTCMAAPVDNDAEPRSKTVQRKSKGRSAENEFRVTRRLRAHAVVVLAILCIQNESLAKKAVPILGKELNVSEDPVVRANIVVALTDMCKRYAILVDPYLPVLTRCLKDPMLSIRHLVLTCLMQLLQQDFVKLHGRLFYRLLTALVDESPKIRELAEFGLVDRILRRHPQVFYQRFIQCLSYFNAYHGISGQASQESVAETGEQDVQMFALDGERNREKRMGIYRFLLQHMSDEERFKLNLTITQNVLGPCVEDEVEAVDTRCPELLQDALRVLCCDEIKLQSVVAADEAASEDDPAQAILLNARKTILSNVVKANVVENVVPVVIALKHKLEAARSPLLRSLLLFLRDLMRDYKNEVKDILASDKKTASEVAFDLRRLEREEGEEEEKQNPSKTPMKAPTTELKTLLDTAKKLKEEAIKRRSIVVLPGVVDDAVPSAEGPLGGVPESVQTVTNRQQKKKGRSKRNNSLTADSDKATGDQSASSVERTPQADMPEVAQVATGNQLSTSKCRNKKEARVKNRSQAMGGDEVIEDSTPCSANELVQGDNPELDACTGGSTEPPPREGTKELGLHGRLPSSNKRKRRAQKDSAAVIHSYNDVEASISEGADAASESNVDIIESRLNCRTEEPGGDGDQRGHGMHEATSPRLSPSASPGSGHRTSGRLRCPRRRFSIEVGDDAASLLTSRTSPKQRNVDSPASRDFEAGSGAVFKRPSAFIKLSKGSSVQREILISTSTPTKGNCRERLIASPDISAIK